MSLCLPARNPLTTRSLGRRRKDPHAPTPRVSSLALAGRPGAGRHRPVTGVSAPASAHEERPARVPRRHRAPPGVPRLRQPAAPGGVPAGQRRAASRRCPTGALKRRNERLLARVRLRLDPDRDQLDHTAAARRSTCSRASTTRAGGPARSAATTARTSRPRRRHPLAAAEYIGSLSSPDTGAQEGTNGDSRTRSRCPTPTSGRCPHNLNLIAIFGDRTPGTTTSPATAGSAAPRSSAPAGGSPT